MDRPKATTQAPSCLQMDRSLETHAEPVFGFVFLLCQNESTDNAKGWLG